MLLAAGALLLASLLRLGLAARMEPLALPGDVAAAEALLSGSRALAEEEERRSRPLAPGERLDPNRADEVELDRLPGVGPALARAIVKDREERGPFRSTGDLDRVPGVGAATLARIGEHLALPGTGVPGAEAPSRRPAGGAQGATTAPLVDLNRAAPAELEALPGIGPALAGRIVDHRGRHGPFRTVEDLAAVPGIGPVLLERLRGRVRVGP